MTGTALPERHTLRKAPNAFTEPQLAATRQTTDSPKESVMSRTDRRQIATLDLPLRWRELLRAIFGYSPERHYIRGPGPAWRAKNARPK